jgi:hypothetical protein
MMLHYGHNVNYSFHVVLLNCPEQTFQIFRTPKLEIDGNRRTSAVTMFMTLAFDSR